jgi:hypothetical protein
VLIETNIATVLLAWYVLVSRLKQQQGVAPERFPRKM